MHQVAGTSGNTGKSTSAYKGAAEENKELLERQNQIEQFVFKDHVDEIEKMGFVVTHTGVVEDGVEVGISPYEEAFVDYLNNNLGKEQMDIVEGEINMLYIAPDSPDASTSSPAAGETTNQPAAPVDENLEDDKMTIQITSVNGEESIAENTSANNETEDKAVNNDAIEDAKLISAKIDPVSSSLKETSTTGIVVVIVVAAVILLTAIILITRKQKAMKR
jgi:hypothetical protein